eukprot:403376038
MGNQVSSACSSCKCVKDEKAASEFDDSKADPMPLQFNSNLLRGSRDNNSSNMRGSKQFNEGSQSFRGLDSNLLKQSLTAAGANQISDGNRLLNRNLQHTNQSQDNNKINVNSSFGNNNNPHLVLSQQFSVLRQSKEERFTFNASNYNYNSNQPYNHFQSDEHGKTPQFKKELSNFGGMDDDTNNPIEINDYDDDLDFKLIKIDRNELDSNIILEETKSQAEDEQDMQEERLKKYQENTNPVHQSSEKKKPYEITSHSKQSSSASQLEVVEESFQSQRLSNQARTESRTTANLYATPMRNQSEQSSQSFDQKQNNPASVQFSFDQIQSQKQNLLSVQSQDYYALGGSGKKNKDSNSESVGQLSQSSTIRTVKVSIPQNIQKQPVDMMHKMRCIIKIQARFRAYKERKQFLSRQTETVKRKYFTSSEFWETIHSEKLYDSKTSREKREHIYKCSEAVYKGEWIGAFRDGFGKIVWQDGASYEGEWLDNRAHGYGKFIHAIGDIYEGMWYRDKACGHGIYKSVNSGGTYNGEWKNDLQHGRGVETWQDGSTYEGEFIMGEKSGIGKQIWPDKSIFIGQWSNNMINGIGRQQWNDNRKYEGEFEKNLMHGFGKFTFSDGKSYEGFYQNDKKHGYGIFTWLNGKRYEGWWTDGKQNGFGILIDKARKVFGIWQDGQKIKQLNEEEAKIVLKEHDKAMHQYMDSRGKIGDIEQIERLTFYSPQSFQTKQKEVTSMLKLIEQVFEESQINFSSFNSTSQQI